MFEDYIKKNEDKTFTMKNIWDQMKETIKLTFKSIEHLFKVIVPKFINRNDQRIMIVADLKYLDMIL